MLQGQSIRYLLICGVGILSFILLAIYPHYKKLDRMNMEIKSTRSQIKEQEILYPIGKNILDELMAKETWDLPFPEKAKLGRDKAAEISGIFKEIARKSNLEPVNIVPDVKSLTEQTGLLSVDIIVRGGFFDFRKFFIHMGELPYLEQIEEVQIQPVEAGREFKLKIWLALK